MESAAEFEGFDPGAAGLRGAAAGRGFREKWCSFSTPTSEEYKLHLWQEADASTLRSMGNGGEVTAGYVVTKVSFSDRVEALKTVLKCDYRSISKGSQEYELIVNGRHGAFIASYYVLTDEEGVLCDIKDFLLLSIVDDQSFYIYKQ